MEDLATVIPLRGQNQSYTAYGFSDKSAEFRATKVFDSVRYKEMSRWQSYFECKQHDWKRYDFDGRLLRQGAPGWSAPLLSSERANWYVPLKMRRPSTPYRIGRSIPTSFTNMVFGEGRWPDILVNGDEDAQDFVNALVEAVSFQTVMIKARNVGGAVGTVGLSWCYHNGDPHVEVHNGKNIVVHEWRDRGKFIPKHVTEIYKYDKDHWDPKKRAYVREAWWHRQDWTETSDVVFFEVKADSKGEPNWVVDEDNTTIHDDGFCHFVYIQNIPALEGIDGSPDADGVWEQMDTLDILWSILSRGTVLNLDPTLKLRMDPELIESAFIRKGSDNALVTGTDGDASYMELAGTSVTAGVSLVRELRNNILETTECVIPDPDKVAAAGTSSVALKMIYNRMLGKCDILREQYGAAIREILRQMLVVAQRMYPVRQETVTYDDGTSEETEVEGFVNLPPKVWSEPLVDIETGEETGEEEIHIDAYVPGKSSYIELSWGPYFKPTSDDKQKTVATLSQATGGKQFCAQKTAVEILANELGRDPHKMLEELEKELDKDQAKNQAMMDSMGGEPGGPVEPIEEEETDLGAGEEPGQPLPQEAYPEEQ